MITFSMSLSLNPEFLREDKLHGRVYMDLRSALRPDVEGYVNFGKATGIRRLSYSGAHGDGMDSF
jgi:hypothetical protein